MTQRVLTVSTVAYDGRPLDVALAGLARAGARFVEPAFIKGYMDFDEADLSEAAGVAMSRRIRAHGLGCVAVSLHMDQGAPDAAEALARRLRFAAAVGAKIAITNAARRAHRDALSAVIERGLPLAETLGVAIALENPGHGEDDLVPDGRRGAELVAAFASPWLGLNYDTGNALTYSEGRVRPEADVHAALPALRHVHLKDVVRTQAGWKYVAVGAGEIDLGPIFAALESRPDAPIAVELPLRLARGFGAAATRVSSLPELPLIEDFVQQSLLACSRFSR